MTRHESRGMTVDDVDVTVDITVEGEEKPGERVMIDLKDRAARVLQALESGEHPDECDGWMISIDWDAILDDDTCTCGAGRVCDVCGGDDE